MEVADTVRKATPDDLPQISAALSRAFFDDPLMAGAIPDQERRRRLMPEFFALFTRAFLRHDKTYTAGDIVGAALWAPPGAVPVSGEDAEELGERIAELTGPDAPRFLGVNKLFDDHHPHGSYWYLQFLGSPRPGRALNCIGGLRGLREVRVQCSHSPPGASK
jgi:hypothetical protein